MKARKKTSQKPETNYLGAKEDNIIRKDWIAYLVGMKGKLVIQTS